MEETPNNNQPMAAQGSQPAFDIERIKRQSEEAQKPASKFPSAESVLSNLTKGGNGQMPKPATDMVAAISRQPVSEYRAPERTNIQRPTTTRPTQTPAHKADDTRTSRPARRNTRNRREKKSIDDFFTGKALIHNGDSGHAAVPTQPMSSQTATPKLRVIPLGGVEEIGKNMTAIEYGNDIMIIDMGLMFPDEAMLGIDYVIPDVSYLEERKDKIRGVVITHGHLDHIGAVPYLIGKLGNPPIFTSPLTAKLVEKRLEEFGLVGKVAVNVIQIGVDVLQFGVFKVESFRLAHSIPDAMGLAVFTPEGMLMYCTDWKLDHTPSDGRPTDLRRIAQLSATQPLALFSESTNIDKQGHSISEREIEKNLVDIFENHTNGRIMVAMFASLISRIQQVLNASAKTGRKVALVGRSMVDNVDAALSIDAIKLPADTLIDIRDIGKYPDDKICIISTGAQGEEMSGLYRISTGEHRQVRVKKGDTIVLATSPIPGNEKSISSVMDNLLRQGAKVIYNKMIDIHSSGHAYQEDLKLMLSLVQPKHLVPIHGERHKLVMHGQLGQSLGIPAENVLICDNGQVLEFSGGVGRVSEERVPAGYVMVDGLGIGDVGNIVLRDRRVMAEDGIFVVIVTLDHNTGKMVTSPDIISRGFIYMRENEDLVHAARAEVKKHFSRHTETRALDANLFKNDIREKLGEFLYTKTQRRPMVVPVVIEV